MFLELAPRIARVILTKTDHPRSEDPANLARIARGFGFDAAEVEPAAAAIRQAVATAGSEDVVLAAGSLFVVGSALAAWNTDPKAFEPSER